MLWSDGHESWVKETNLPSAVFEIVEKKGSYEVNTQSVEEFGQKRSLLELRSEGKIGKEAELIGRQTKIYNYIKYLSINNNNHVLFKLQCWICSYLSRG